ncbi:LytR/AlgR family response regulator transcription factor [Limosilactobacillus caviae]|uniref:DNA-binding response regulator n=1 Tax=Limosilactobacillus caviae TaxID=1769424 RepID=A0ABQ2C7X9_9LACO|nr:LytTR family DNA-binding domain-containing protein [Limosilactobacillus caviae]MCD7123242.1 LytTR family DNA-binding domain-containing protein [Limosilactobacillus caviae]MRH46712.1 response regulator [Limosilactobacillus reuteri]GGI63854.1 DNA-binding response regulator [Limosilactobacillus caviae]
MINVYILEDQVEEQHLLHKLIINISNELDINTQTTIHPFSDDHELKLHLPEPSIDNVYILDLEIHGNKKAGLALSKIIRKHDHFATIIFLTVHDEFLLTTYKYQVEALDFIEKGHNSIEADLKRDFTRILEKKRQDPSESLTLPTSIGFINVPLETILFFQSAPSNTRHSILHTQDSQQLIKVSLKSIEEQSHFFFRAHRSFVVNLQNITTIDIKTHLIHFKNTLDTIPISRLKTRAIISRLRANQVNW